MSPNTSAKLFVNVRVSFRFLPVALLFVAGQILHGTAQTCSPRCLSCNNQNSTCTQCQAGFTVHQGACEACGANCVTCNFGESCTTCDTRYGPIINTTNCSPCVDNCDVCQTNLTSCDSCSAGYEIRSDRTCGPSSSSSNRPVPITSGSTSATSSVPGGGTSSTISRSGGISSTTGSTTLVSNQPRVSSSSGMPTPAPTGSTTNPMGNPNNTSTLPWMTFAFTASTSAVRTPTTTIAAVGQSVENTWCPILEVGLGLGIPCGVILFVLVIIVTALCVENRHLREYKRQNEDKPYHQTIVSSPSTSTLHPPTVPYQPLNSPGSQRSYEQIDRHDTISTAVTESTGHYETPLSVSEHTYNISVQ